MNKAWLKISRDRRQTNWLFTSVDEDLNLGLRRNNSGLVVKMGIQPDASGLQVQRLNHSGTMPPYILSNSTITS